MAKRHVGLKLLAGFLAGCGVAGAAQAAPTPAQMLTFKPKQQGVNLTTPADAEIPGCKVELIKGAKTQAGKTPSGWLLRDARRQPVRCFLDTDGDNQIDVWAYYLDGQEAYREVDSNFNQKPDQFRWLAGNGSRWGTDLDEDGAIDSWKAISPEEVSQELLAAVATGDSKRFQALLITRAELDALELPDAEAAKIREKATAAVQKFNATRAGLIALSEKTAWQHLETGAPSCTAADSLGSKQDLVKHKFGTILYQNADKHDWLQTGEIVQVGRAWRLIEGPVAGARTEAMASNGVDASQVIAVDAEARPLLEELKKVDAAAPQGNVPAQVAAYNVARADVLERIALKTKPEQREQWIKQLADSLANAGQAGDGPARERLTALKSSLTREAPGSNAAAYATYRDASADYSAKLAKSSKPEDMTKVQEEWRATLTKFVGDFPAAEDAAEACMQLGMAHEFIGKETEAKNWYSHLAKNFVRHPLAAKATGALRRIDLQGKELELSAQKVGSDEPFDITTLRGKPVLVYYWASYNTQTAQDFAKLKAVAAAAASKGLEVVTVNLDANPADGAAFLAKNPIPGTHVYSPAGGLDSPLANQYGVLVLPNLFLVGKDGKVVNRSVQVATLEDEVKKGLGN